jgi:hypothetical protein
MSRRYLLLSAALAGLMAAPVSGSAKAMFVPIVPVPNSTSTNVFGITDSNIVTGSWLDASGVEHGYVGPLSGSDYTTFDDPTPGTEPRGINDGGYIAGFGNSQNGSTSEFIPFVRSPGGTITTVTKKRKALNYLVQGISSSTNVFAGATFIRKQMVEASTGNAATATFRAPVKLSIRNTGAAARAIDNNGDIVGWYYDANGVQNGFLIPAGGTPVTVDDPATDETSTVLEGINDRGVATGYWTDTSGVLHGFTYDIATAKFTPINVPNSVSFVQAWGINNEGLVAIGSDAGYFIYCPSKKVCPKGAARVTPPRDKLHPAEP